MARAHEAAAKVRFLTEENSRKDKQIAQLQANIAKLRSEAREVEVGSVGPANVEASSLEEELRRPSVGTSQTKPARRRGGREQAIDRIDSIDLEDTEGRMKLKQLVAAAKRQKRLSSPVDVPASQPPLQSAADVAARVAADTSRTGQTAAPTKPGKSTRGLRGRTKMGAAGATVPAASVKQQPSADDLPQMSSFWNKTALQEWAPTGADVVDKTATGKQVKTAGGGRSAVQQTPPAPASDVDMNEAIEMTKLYLAGPETQPAQPPQQQQQQQQPLQQPQQKQQPRQQQQQQQRSVKGRQRAPVDEQQQGSRGPHVTAISPQLFAESSAIKAPPPTMTTTTTQRAVATPTLLAGDSAGLSLRAKTPAEAANMRTARLFQTSDDARRRPTPAVPQKQQTPTTKSRPPGKAAGYDLVGVQIQNLARQAKLLESGSMPTTGQRIG